MNGLAPNTLKLIKLISKLDCLKPFVLVGGTALSLQINARQSEDLDFMRWRINKKDNHDVEWHKIRAALSTIGQIENVNLMDFNHVEFIVDGVKMSFYASDNSNPGIQIVPFMDNIVLADIESIGAMKMEVMLRRSNFRDYYDIYSILKEGYSIEIIFEKALKYSRHRLKGKNLLSLLTSGMRFKRDVSFDQLNPKYSVTPSDIENFIKTLLLKHPL